MKYYTLLAFFLVLGMCKTFAQTQDAEPKKPFPNLKTEYSDLKNKEKKAHATDPNSKLDATAARQKLLGPTPPSALQSRTRKGSPSTARLARSAGTNPSEKSSADAEKAHAAKIALQPKAVAPKLEQEGTGASTGGTKPTKTSIH